MLKTYYALAKMTISVLTMDAKSWGVRAQNEVSVILQTAAIS